MELHFKNSKDFKQIEEFEEIEHSHSEDQDEDEIFEQSLMNLHTISPGDEEEIDEWEENLHILKMQPEDHTSLFEEDVIMEIDEHPTFDSSTFGATPPVPNPETLDIKAEVHDHNYVLPTAPIKVPTKGLETPSIAEILGEL